jgi:Predicted membrane protein
MELKQTVRISMLLALSVVLSIIESFFPIFSGSIPGVKIGLANIVIVTVLYLYTFKEAFTVSVLRIVLVGILRTGLFGTTFLFSLFGAIFSLLFMIIAKKTKKLSIIGVSIFGSYIHTLAQIILAIFLLKNVNIIYYLPFLGVISVITGIITGFLSKEIIKIVK